MRHGNKRGASEPMALKKPQKDEKTEKIEDPKRIAEHLALAAESTPQCIAAVSGCTREMPTLLLDLSESGGYCVIDEIVSKTDKAAFMGAERVTLHYELENIVHFFQTRFLEEIDEKKSYKIEYPTVLYRVQRRAQFRVTLTSSQPLCCSFEARCEGRWKPFAGKLDDISTGGVSFTYEGEKVFETGDNLRNLSIALGEDKTLTVHGKVTQMRRLEPSGGKKRVRYGVRFTGLSRRDENFLASQVFRIHREQLAFRSSGE
jgi:c-di-GMP-binding flagellar brake protein YcgR